MKKKTVSVLILLAVINNCANASNFEDGLDDGQFFCEDEWSGDPEDCWGLEDLCEAVIDDLFTIEKGDSPSLKSYKRGGKKGVKKMLREIEKECFHDDVSTCNDLGEDAAAEIAFDLCPTRDDRMGSPPPDYKEECRIEAIDICEGMIVSKFSSICGRRERRVALSMNELKDAKTKCRKTVNSLLKTNLRH